MLSHMALAETGMWATKVNEGHQTVFVVRLSTDALKWIYRGVPVNLLIGHVSVEDVVVRVLALEIFDCLTDPQIANSPQIRAWEIQGFDALLAHDSFTVHFHNEQPFLSLLDATATLADAEIGRYLEKRSKLKFHSAPVPTSVFRKAQDAFEKSLSHPSEDSVPPVEIFRFSFALTKMLWNSMDVLDVGKFVPNDSNEGGSHEALLLQLLKPHFDGTVVASPKIPDGNKTRELCDLLAISKNAFVFEAKAFSVFDKALDQTSHRKVATVMSHFEKALGQLKGAIKRIEKGVDVQAAPLLSPLTIFGKQFGTMHGIIVVSNTNFDLPWLEIGEQLADAQQMPSICYHFLQLAEVQRMVAFSERSLEKLNDMLIHRAAIIACSRDARIRTEYIPKVKSVIKLPPVSADCLGFWFIWLKADLAGLFLRFFPVVYRQFQVHAFSGRLDFYHKTGRLRGSPAIAIGMAAQPITNQLDCEWWLQFRQNLFDASAKVGLPKAAEVSDRIQTLREISSRYSELLLSVEFQDGFVTAISEKDS